MTADLDIWHADSSIHISRSCLLFKVIGQSSRSHMEMFLYRPWITLRDDVFGIARGKHKSCTQHTSYVSTLHRLSIGIKINQSKILPFVSIAQ